MGNLRKLLVKERLELKCLLIIFKAAAMRAYLGFADLWTPVMFNRHHDFVWRSTVQVAMGLPKPF